MQTTRIDGHVIYVDFETRSEVDLGERGAANYFAHPSTTVLLMAYAFDDAAVEIWEPHLMPFPDNLAAALGDPFVVLCAFNAGFEQAVFRRLGYDLPAENWTDVMIRARYVSIPGGLSDVCKAMGLKDDQAKIEDGDRLIRLFCEPKTEVRDTLFGFEPPSFHDWVTRPEDWKLFKQYCIRDVEAERTILKKLARFPFPEIERQGWLLDQKINSRGVPVDLGLVANTLKIANAAKIEFTEQMREITGLANPNSPQQLMAWAKQHGYPYNSMGKVWVMQSLNDPAISKECKIVFKLRQQASKTSWAKLEAVQNIVCDGVVRDQFAFLGSPRAGRWSGRDIQMHNLPKPTKALEPRLDELVELVRHGKFDDIKSIPAMDLVSAMIRPTFRAPDGLAFDIADLNAIENRVLGWITGCDAILDVFRKGLDPYKEFATRMYSIPYERVTKAQRTVAKPGVLAAGYRLSGGEEGEDKWGNPIKSGLWGYAHAMGIEMSKEDAHYSVKIFRDSYSEVCENWYRLEDVAHAVVSGSNMLEACKCTFEMDHGVLTVALPSSRKLHYISPRIESMEFFGKMKPTLTYAGQTDTKQWGRLKTHGGKLMENLCQAIARDILLHGMMLAEQEGINIVAHCHDEIISLNQESRLNDLIRCMATVPKWALGLILDAAGFSSPFYKKD